MSVSVCIAAFIRHCLTLILSYEKNKNTDKKQSKSTTTTKKIYIINIKHLYVTRAGGGARCVVTKSYSRFIPHKREGCEKLHACMRVWVWMPSFLHTATRSTYSTKMLLTIFSYRLCIVWPPSVLLRHHGTEQNITEKEINPNSLNNIEPNRT